MSSYTHFTLEERKYLQQLLAEGYSMRKIAAALGRHPSSISREISRNRSKYPPKRPSDNRYNYHHWRAHTLSIVRRRQQWRYRLNPDTPEWEYIIAKLKLYWSPEEIVNRWNLDKPNQPCFSVSGVYRAIKRNAFPGISRREHLRRRGKFMLPRNSNYNSIQPDRIIPEWPEEIRRRQRIGDWEGDTVYGGIGKGFVVTQVDRKSRFLRAGLLAKRDAALTRDVIINIMNGLPVLSMSLDNGSEFAAFREIEKELDTVIYFAEPHKPWQRGTNENTNGILRFFFPKGFDFRTITQADLDFVVDLINNRPRKCLDWQTPAEIFYYESVALA